MLNSRMVFIRKIKVFHIINIMLILEKININISVTL